MYESPNVRKAAEEYVRIMSGEKEMTYYPAFHAAPPIGWINDPNGFVYFNGYYRLYCQFHPYSSEWGPMHWGQWTSLDLVHWEWQGVVLAPDTHADAGGCFSGTAVVKNGKLIIMYTGLEPDGIGGYWQQQCLAYSSDGIHFEKEKANPVINRFMYPKGSSPQDARDPKLFIHEDGTWRVIFAGMLKNEGVLFQYISQDLINWKFKNVFFQDGLSMMECPDIISNQEQKALVASVITHPPEKGKFVNSRPCVLFRGKYDEFKDVFFAEYEETLDCGWDFYAPQSIQGPDGRRLMIGWMQCWQHNMPTSYLGHGWNGCMSLTREIIWKDNKIKMVPVKELASLRKREVSLNSGLQEIPQLSEIQLEYICKPLTVSVIRFKGSSDDVVEIRIDFKENCVYLDCSAAGYSVCGKKDALEQTRACAYLDENGNGKLRIYLDRSCLEVFVDDGQSVISSRIFPQSAIQYLEIDPGEQGKIQGVIYELQA